MAFYLNCKTVFVHSAHRPQNNKFLSNLALLKMGRVAKCAKSTVEYVGVIINRPRAVNDRPYIRRM